MGSPALEPRESFAFFSTPVPVPCHVLPFGRCPPRESIEQRSSSLITPDSLSPPLPDSRAQGLGRPALWLFYATPSFSFRSLCLMHPAATSELLSRLVPPFVFPITLTVFDHRSRVTRLDPPVPSRLTLDASFPCFPFGMI